MAVTIYGIRNCDTMKKAFAWLEGHGVAFDFHNYRPGGISRGQVERWCDAAGWESVINRSGRTFRALPDDVKAAVDRAKAVDLMIAEPTMIRRPVLDTGEKIEIGFRPERYAALLGE